MDRLRYIKKYCRKQTEKFHNNASFLFRIGRKTYFFPLNHIIAGFILHLNQKNPVAISLFSATI